MVGTIKRNVEKTDDGLLKVTFVTDDNKRLFNVCNHELVLSVDNKLTDYLVEKYNNKYTKLEIALILGTVKFKFSRSLEIENDGSILMASTKKHLRQITMDVIDWLKKGIRYLSALERDKIENDSNWLKQIEISIDNAIKSAEDTIIKTRR